MQSEKFSMLQYTVPVSSHDDKDQAARKVRKELNGVFLIAAHIEHYTKLKKSVIERYYRNEQLEDILYD